MTVPLDTVNDIRSTEAAGRPGFKIARALHLSRNTVAKYADIENMSPAATIPPKGGPGRHSSKSESTPSLIYRHEELNHFPSMHANSRPNNRMTHHSIRGPQTSSELEPDRRKQFTQF